ncbi:hypothetical protein M9Y10_018312 [Tritrichomonas musculus]|uniref:Uncharacterized protein n=1 Tax=Tritrichomonas musculus TaxID=1915356 RepID=A0ABR2GL80_9EUKA
MFYNINKEDTEIVPKESDQVEKEINPDDLPIFNKYNKNDLDFKEFQPKEKLFYCFFAETQVPNSQMVNNKYKKIFGINNSQDIQRFCFYPNTKKKISTHYQIYKFHSVFHYPFQITNSQTVSDNTNNNDINSNESNENNESRNQNPKTQIEQEYGFKANQNQNEIKANDLPKFNKYNKNDPRIERATFHLLGERNNH